MPRAKANLARKRADALMGSLALNEAGELVYPLPWSVVAALYQQRTGMRTTTENARQTGATAHQKMRRLVKRNSRVEVSALLMVFE